MKKLELKASDYGMEENAVNEIKKGLDVPKAERELLIKEFEVVSKLEITKENLPKFKELRLKLQKNRTQGINVWHKKGKEVSLRLGQLYDAIKNNENGINEAMESKLMEAEKHFETVERERLESIQNERIELIKKYVEEIDYRDYSTMEPDVWEAYFNTKKKAFEDKIEQEKIEAKRIKDFEEKEAKFNDRMQRVIPYSQYKEDLNYNIDIREADDTDFDTYLDVLHKMKQDYEKKAEEQRLENVRLKKEADLKAKKGEVDRLKREAEQKIKDEAAAKILEVERLEKDKLAQQIQEKEDKEKQVEIDRLAAIEADLKKGDSDKIKDLKSDLHGLKTKYEFKSKSNQSKYSNVGGLIDKVINYIND